MVQNSLVEAKEKGLSLKVMFQDEARFGRINDPKRCWCRGGFRPEVGKQVVREYVYAYGAFCPSDGAADFLILPYMDTENMNIFLSELSVRYPNELILLICDKAPCHSSGILRIPNNIKVLHLPAYCPQLNPSENMWEEMREKFFTNLVFNSINAVADKLVEAMNFYESRADIVKSITGFNWIVTHI